MLILHIKIKTRRQQLTIHKSNDKVINIHQHMIIVVDGLVLWNIDRMDVLIKIRNIININSICYKERGRGRLSCIDHIIDDINQSIEQIHIARFNNSVNGHCL